MVFNVNGSNQIVWNSKGCSASIHSSGEVDFLVHRCLREIQHEVNIISALPKLKQFFKVSEIHARLEEYRQQILTLRDNFTVRQDLFIRLQ